MLVERIQDIGHFLITFHTPISFSTPHVYISTRPFLPSQSTLSRMFSSEFTRAINIRVGRLSSWPAPPLEWIGHAQFISSVCYSPDGTRVVSGSEDKTIRIWDAESGTVLGLPLMGHTDLVRSVAYSPDGRRIISGSEDYTIRIWDAETGTAVGNPLEGHAGAVNSIAYSPDGRHIISGSYDSTIRIWDADNGTAVGSPLEGHADWVHSVAYSPDGRHITSASDDHTIRIWDAENGTAVGSPLVGHAGPVCSVAYSPDRQRIASGSSDNTNRVWDPFQYVPFPPSCDPVHPDFCAKPDTAGWVRDSQGGLLYWVPYDLRTGVHSPAILTIPLTSPTRNVSLDFDDFAFGTSWTQIFKSAPS